MRYALNMAQSKVAQHLVTALENLRKERVAVEARIATVEKLLSRQSAVEKAAAKAKVTKRGRKPVAEAPVAKKRGRPAKASKAASLKALIDAWDQRRLDEARSLLDMLPSESKTAPARP